MSRKAAPFFQLLTLSQATRKCFFFQILFQIFKYFNVFKKNILSVRDIREMRILLALTLMSAALAQTFAANEADALRLVKDLKLGQGKNSIKFRPRYGESPTQVGMSMYVLAINDISETVRIRKYLQDYFDMEY